MIGECNVSFSSEHKLARLEIYIVYDLYPSQSKHSQNIRRRTEWKLTCCGNHRNIGLKCRLQSQFSIHFLLCKKLFMQDKHSK